MARKPEYSLKELTFLMHAWRAHCPTKSFGGVTLEQFSELILKKHENEAEIEVLKEERKALRAKRDAADARVLELLDGIEAEMKAYAERQKS